MAAVLSLLIVERQKGHAEALDPRSCSGRVTAYLQQVVTRRAELEARETRARAELNEARNILEEERSGQRAPAAETHHRIKAAWTVFESATSVLLKFDEDVANAYTDLPLVCFREADALRSAVPLDVLRGNVAKYMMESLLFHLRLYGETLRGVVHFTLQEYDDTVLYYQRVSNYYANKSQKAFDEIRLRQRNHGIDDESYGLWGMTEIVFLYLDGIVSAALPWMLLFSVCFFTLLFAPFVFSGVLLPNFIWAVWVKLFIMHHVYRLTCDSFLVSMQRYKKLFFSGERRQLLESFSEALVSLANGGNNGETLFNGIIAAGFCLFITMLMIIFMYIWVEFLVLLVEPTVDLLKDCGGSVEETKDTAAFFNSSAASLKKGTTTTTTNATNIPKLANKKIPTFFGAGTQRPGTGVSNSFLRGDNERGKNNIERLNKKKTK